MAKFNLRETGIDGLVVIEPTVYGDSRGAFFESYNKREYASLGLDMEFVQDNQSSSVRGVLRGLHFQLKHAQGKLVRVIRGEVFDVAVDLRPGSPTFSKWYGVYLSEENRLSFYVPPGFAHGFLVVSDRAEFVYKCTDFYYPEYESGILYNDPELAVQWPIDRVSEVILSDKDKKLGSFAAAKGSFNE